MLNHVTIMGRFAADPELRRTNSGKAVTSFRLAVSRPKRDDGADWIDCVAWEGRAETICNYFTKGKLIVVQGRLTNRAWTDKDGNKRNAVEVIVSDFDFCGRDGGATNDQTTVGSQAPGNYEIIDGDDEELPF